MDLDEEYWYEEGISSHLEYYNEEVRRELYDNTPLLITCFSEEKDKLRQWRAYGEDGMGVAIGFNYKKILQLEEDFYISPKVQIKNYSGERPVLIMHSSEDPEVPFSNFERIIKNALEHAEVWIREGYHHFIVERDSLLNPQNDKEYSERVLQFLDNHFDN